MEGKKSSTQASNVYATENYKLRLQNTNITVFNH